MLTIEFDYCLPKELIAQYPTSKRDQSRLLILTRNAQTIEHRKFSDIINYMNRGEVLVLNETKVIPARLIGHKETAGCFATSFSPGGGKVEIFLLKVKKDNTWEVLIKPGKASKTGTRIIIGEELMAEVVDKNTVRFEYEGDFRKILEKYGRVPLPPYIKREPDKLDKSRYQTIYAKKEGAVAAPTAGLHFTKKILELLRSKGVKIVNLCLHTGLGTFRPVKEENIEEHKMESEYYEITGQSVEIIDRAKRVGKRVIAIGTTTVRALETMRISGNYEESLLSGWTDLFIYPGYNFKVVDALVTNFHLPKSTLLMLVSAFAGKDLILKAYNEAIRQRYRFYSYGDCMFIL